jgi:hypothetical protein
MHAVSLIPHAWCMWCHASCMRYHWHRMHVCIRYHWYRRHGACGVIDTTCMVYAVSLTPHAQQIFRTTLKSENHLQNSVGLQKKLKRHAVSMTPHAWYMRCHWYRMNDAWGVIGTACTVHVVSLTLHAKYDTACTINEWFEWLWQPLTH